MLSSFHCKQLQSQKISHMHAHMDHMRVKSLRIRWDKIDLY